MPLNASWNVYEPFLYFDDIRITQNLRNAHETPGLALLT